MGMKSRRKGKTAELEVTNGLQDGGFGAQRVPNSGSSGGRFEADVHFSLRGREQKIEVKRRKNEFKKFYEWIEGADFLALRDDHKDWLIVLRGKKALFFAKLLEGI